MGGLGSGGRRTRLGVDECRALEIGELADDKAPVIAARR